MKPATLTMYSGDSAEYNCKDPNNKFHDYLVQMFHLNTLIQYIFNYNKMKEDGTPDTNWNTAVQTKHSVCHRPMVWTSQTTGNV